MDFVVAAHNESKIAEMKESKEMVERGRLVLR
jgi:hypothetical protein